MVRQIIRNLVLDIKKNFQFFQISFFFFASRILEDSAISNLTLP